MNQASYLTDFVMIRPPYESDQNVGLEWLLEAHIEAERKNLSSTIPAQNFRNIMKKAIEKYCCKKENISRRGHILDDFNHRNWEKMVLFSSKSKSEGEGIGVRTQIYGKYVESIFERFYPDKSTSPDDLIHVTCTGYLAPSAAQKIVSKRKWETVVTHAYHMGCMGAMPAIRIGSGFSKMGKKRIDVVHTEISTIHFNPSLHAPDQLVGQSLFADGFIKYTLSSETKKKASFQILAIEEKLLPETAEEMKWECEDWGLKLTLSKTIPQHIGESVIAFVEKIAEKAGVGYSTLQKNAIFAIHPGGPKIVDQLREKLALSTEQIAASQKILQNYGNMSSATLPHIWDSILSDQNYKNDTMVISLAFGPGICISGAIMIKKNEV